MLENLIVKKTTINYNPFTKNYFLIGPPKIGKSTLAATFGKNPLIISTEKGYDYIVGVNLVEIPSFGKGNLHKRWGFLTDVLNDIVASPAKYTQYDTIVFDVIDSISHWGEIALLKQMKIDHESKAKWGEAYTRKERGFIEFIELVKEIKGKGVMFISHADTNVIEMDQNQITQIGSRCTKKLKNQVEGLCDFVFMLFANKDGKRFIQTRGNANILAGSRLPTEILPEFIPVNDDYKTLWNLINNKQTTKEVTQ